MKELIIQGIVSGMAAGATILVLAAALERIERWSGRRHYERRANRAVAKKK